MRHLCLTLLALLTVALAPAATPPHCIFTHYTTLDGLSHNNIADIHVDSRGFVWTATWCGINRFDGYHFRNFHSEDDASGLSFSRFTQVEEDAAGNMWFRTYENHICMLNRATEKLVDISTLIPEIEADNYSASVMLCDDRGRTWIGIEGYGLAVIDSESRDVVTMFGNDSLGKSIGHIALLEDGGVWVVANGRHLWRVGTTEESEVVATSVAVMPGLVSLLVSDRRQGLFAACGNDVVHVDATTLEQRIYRGDEQVTSVAIREDLVAVGSAEGHIGQLGDGNILYPRPASGSDTCTHIRSLMFDSHGLVWAISHENGVVRYDPSRRHYRRFHQPFHTTWLNYDEAAMVVEHDDRVWIKMRGTGFGWYDRANDRVEPFYNDPSRGDCRMGNDVVTFCFDKNGVLWFTTSSDRGLYKGVFASSPDELFEDMNVDPDGEIRALTLDGDGNMWVGTRTGHLYCFDSDGRSIWKLTREEYPPLDMIYCLMADSENNIWVGTKGFGLFRLSPDGHGGRTIKRYLHSDDDLWSLNCDTIYSIAEDAEHRIWLATYGGGVNMLSDARSDRFIHAGNLLKGYPLDHAAKLRYIIADNPQRMLAGSTEGLLVFNPSEIAGGESDEGSFRLWRRDKNDDNSLSNNNIIHIGRDVRGRMWLSTFGGGINLLERWEDGKPRFERIMDRQGLKNNVVLATIEDDNGTIWAMTETGVAQYHAQSGTFTSYAIVPSNRNLSFNEATILKDGRGMLFFGGNRDLYRLNPDDVPEYGRDYNLHFTSLEVDNSPMHCSIDMAERVELPADYISFTIGFAALNARIQEHVHYRYCLEGYDKGWIAGSGAHSATYSNVPHGRYTFRVKACVGGDLESSAEISKTIVIRPPLWLSWWAYILYAIAVAALLFGVYRMMYLIARLRSETRLNDDLAEMKLQFFTNISHELRTPLTLILGGIDEVASDEALSEQGRASIALASKNARRMLMLVNQLLDFRKVVKGKMVLKYSHFDVVEFVGRIVDDFRKVASSHRIELLFAFSHRNVMIWADIQRIESVVYNLMTNAFKFTPDGHRIDVSVSVRENDREVVISVHDTGVGISKEKLEHIFERFTPVSRSIRNDMQGSGIGLSLCREIVELHQGQITIESRQGEGTTVRVRIPVGEEPKPEGEVAGEGTATSNKLEVNDFLPPAEDESRIRGVTPPEGAKTILVVDDNAEMRAFIYNHLIADYNVVEAADGEEALQVIAATPPDVVITDLMMPRLDGIGLIRSIRKDFKTSHLPVIMLTAKHNSDDRIKAMEYGADGYITKPFSTELLAARIENLLTQRRLLFEKFSAQHSSGHTAEELTAPKEVVVTDRDELFIRKAIAWIDENIENSDLKVDALASHLDMGRTSLYNKIKGLTNKSPVELIMEYRIRKAELYLKTGKMTVADVAYKVGFSDPGYFSRCFKSQTGMSPSAYQKSAATATNTEEEQ